jgi:soluble lytic murein transglycosylase-like protein
MDEDMQEFIYCLSHGYSIDFPFVMAVIEHESSFREDVISGTSDYGLMQINKINHKWLKETIGVTDFLDPYDNVRSGVFILRQLFEKYDDPAMVLMAYNMGETGAGKLWDKGVYSTDYAEDILLQADKYTKEIQERMGEE